jgi:ribonuclease HI
MEVIELKLDYPGRGQDNWNPDPIQIQLHCEELQVVPDTPLIIRPQVTIYTDGACQGNPGPGAWASILSCKGHTRELKGFIPSSTNNQAELTAIHQALQALNRPCTVQLYTDSQYAIGVLSKGFKRKTNLNLLRQIDELSIQHFITYHFIQGHAGSSGNERADELANLAPSIRASVTQAQIQIDREFSYMTVPHVRLYPTLSQTFFRGTIQGQINAIHSSYKINPTRLEDYKRALLQVSRENLTHLFPRRRRLCKPRSLRISGGRRDQICDPSARQSDLAGADQLSAQTPGWSPVQ